MSYLRALVRKTQNSRPAIAPRLASPAAPPILGLEEVVEQEIVTTARRVSPAIPAFAERPAAATSRRDLTAPAAREDGDRKLNEPAPPAANDRALPFVPLPPEPASLQRTVKRTSRLIGRRASAPPPETPESGEAPLPADREDRPLIVRRKPPTAAVDPPLYPRVSPGAAAPVIWRERDIERPDVHISIGRLEVRAHVAAPAKAERTPPFRPQLTLQDYLARRSGGQ